MIRAADRLMAAILLALAIGAVAAEKTYDLSEVKVTRTDSGFIYTYRDESGQLIVRDVPPPGYLEALTVERARQEVVADIPDEPPPPVPAPAAKPASWPEPVMWLLSAVLVIASGYIFFTPFIRRWRNESKLERVLRHAGFPVFTDVDMDISGHPPTRIDCLACTPAGVLVIGDVVFAGKVSGRPDDDFWMQAVRNDRMQVDNPLRKNNQDTRIVSAVLGDVPVFGHVVYGGRTELPDESTEKMQRLVEFSQNLGLFETQAPDQRSLAGGWRTLMRFPRANRVVLRPMGSGRKRWLHYHWRAIASGSLLLLSATIMLVLLSLRWLKGG